MTPISLLWTAFAALGAGTIHLAVGAGAPLPLAILFAGVGAAEIGWGVATLVRGRVLVADLAVVGALIPVFVWGATATLRSGFGLPADAAGLPVFPMAVATLFSVFVALSLAVARRRAASESAATGTPQGRRFLAALALGGLLVSGLTTPALAATDAGAHAVPHGSHSEPAHAVLPESPHSHH
ncbi:hypothetical protein E3T26_15385 [Cryobacterium sp. TMT1-21]|uniref:hypothetical protein n=1 Tax=Cryobacterium sp. TMT1-21 TaxID=1259234 RepID=UPI001068FD2E|nr:hypothetical protein [Cryobacterium sp. TMT1-21]TFD08600.1 hypothetical protein E3T26_15385 [Cryobacterium sp. TMT1-21]